MSPELDRVTAADWLRGMAGEHAFEILWKPLLAAKIGDAYASLPALWVSSRMHREKNVGPEVKGCLRHGYRSLIDAFERRLRERGASIRTSARVERIERDGDRMGVRLADGRCEAHDYVVSTSPLVQFQSMTAALSLEPSIAKLELDYQGVVSGVFLMKRALSPYYWTPFVDSGATAQGAIEMSNLMPLERAHGLHVTYLVNYAHRDSAVFARTDAELLQLYRRDLEALFPGSAAAVVDQFVFRAPFVEPVWPLHYSRLKPPASVIPGRLYLACTAQVYPHVNSWSWCCAVVGHEADRGLGAGLRTGIYWCLDRAGEDDVIVTLDADGTHPPALIPELVASLRPGFDLAIASRYRRGSEVRGVPAYRRALSD